MAAANSCRCCCRGHHLASLDLRLNLSDIINSFRRTSSSVCHPTVGGLPNGLGGKKLADLRNIVTVRAPFIFRYLQISFYRSLGIFSSAGLCCLVLLMSVTLLLCPPPTPPCVSVVCETSTNNREAFQEEKTELDTHKLRHQVRKWCSGMCGRLPQTDARASFTRCSASPT